MKILAALFLATVLSLHISVLPSQESAELNEASALSESVSKLFAEKKYDQALPLAKKVLQIREKLLPPTDPRIAISLNHLGDLYIVKGDNEAARQIFERLLQLQAERTAPDHISLAPTVERLAIIYYRQEAKSKSDDYYQRALALRERAFGAESLNIAQSRSAMAQFYRGEKDFDRAARSYRRSISIYGKTSGVDSPEFERAMDGFTCLAYESKQPNAIREVEMTRTLFAPHRPIVLVENAILNGRAISLPRPEYPADARARNLSGTVTVKVEVDETGRVINAIDMCQGPPYLSESSVKAALKARFTPTKLSGVPVKVKGVIQYNFVRQ